MRKFLFFPFLFFVGKGNAQFDTSYINRVVEYANSAKFREDYNDSVSAQYARLITSQKIKRKERKRSRKYMAFDSTSMAKKCFFPAVEYFIPDPITGVKFNDSLSLSADSLYHRAFKKGGSIASRVYLFAEDICTDRIRCEIFFLRANIIELRYFTGSPVSVAIHRFGNEEHFRFKVNPDMTVTFLKRTRAIYD